MKKQGAGIQSRSKLPSRQSHYLNEPTKQANAVNVCIRDLIGIRLDLLPVIKKMFGILWEIVNGRRRRRVEGEGRAATGIRQLGQEEKSG